MNSYEEKRLSVEETGNFERWMFVGELMEFLKQFKEDDWIMANMVYNLNVHRDGVKGFWVIDMHWNTIEDYTESDDESQEEETEE